MLASHNAEEVAFGGAKEELSVYTLIFIQQVAQNTGGINTQGHTGRTKTAKT